MNANIATKESVQRIEVMIEIEANRQVMTDSAATEFECPQG